MAADLILTGGPVLAPDGTPRYGLAVVVRDGWIAAVVPAEELAEHRGPRTQVVDQAGGMLTPGFQDAHVHPVQGGSERRHCDLTGLGTAAAYLERIAVYADTHPDEPWVLGGGWELAAFPPSGPTRQALDAVVPDRPAHLPNRDHHGTWANTRALVLAGIDRDTPDPRDGRIERDAAGEPTGLLHEGAVGLVERVVPDETPAEVLDALLEGQRHLHSLGVTAWQDAIVGAYLGHGDPFEAYVEAERRSLLTARVRGALWWDRERGLEQVDDLLARRDATKGRRFDAGAVKVMLDGIVENGTAALLDPYVGHAGDGLLHVDPELLAAAVTTLDARGVQVHVHAIGDRAVRVALDAFEAARTKNGPSPNRHHLAHVQVVHPDDVPRFAALEVTATVQALWACHEPQMDDLTLPVLGPQRSAWQYPFADLARAGTLAMGSDWPVTSADPWLAVHTAVTRTTHGEDHDAFLPDQGLTLAQALRAATAGSAYVDHLDHETGTVAPGMRADLALADRDPFAGSPEGIGATKTVTTWVDGRVVHGADPAGR